MPPGNRCKLLVHPMYDKQSRNLMSFLRNRSAYLCVVIAMVLAVGLSAQRRARAFDTGSDPRPMGRAVTADWSVGIGGLLLYYDIATLNAAEAICGVVAPGGIFVLSDTDIVVSGRGASGGGRLEHWRYNVASDALVLVSSVSKPGADYAGVFFRPANNALYLLDCVANQILRGTWDGISALASVSFTPWVGTATLPYLTNSSSLTVVASHKSVDVLQLVEWPMRGDGAAYVSVGDVGGVPSITFGVDDGHKLPVFLDPLGVTEGASIVVAWAPMGTQVEVVDVDSSVVLGSSTAGSNGEVAITLNQPLTIGSRYAARFVGQPVPPNGAITCVCRHGAPEVFADGTEIAGMYYQRGARTGAQFVVEVGLRDGSAPTSDVAYEGMMLIGFRTGPTDPVVPYGNNVLLATSVYVPAQGLVSHRNGWGMVASSVTIPDDPGLVGLVFLVQFVMEDGPDYRLSQIYGSLIEGSSNVGMQSFVATAQSPAAAPSSSAAAHIQAAMATGRVLDATLRLIHVVSRR
jgi:hypothetical protein